MLDFIKETIEKYPYICTLGGAIIGFFVKVLYNLISVKHKLKTEYGFNQKKSIKESLAKIKTPLIKACEEMNYRLWNLNENFDKQWHNVKEIEWTKDEKHYIRSTVYRLLVFFYWINEADNSIYNFDFAIADKKDKEYLKHIKVLKYHFSTPLEINGVKHNETDSNHFYKNNIPKYVNFIKNKEGGIIDFDEFEKKLKEDLSPIKKVFFFISKIDNTGDKLNYNMIIGFHFLIIKFLNKYGLNYHHTSYKKRINLMHNYKDYMASEHLLKYLDKNKLNYADIPCTYFQKKAATLYHWIKQLLKKICLRKRKLWEDVKLEIKGIT